MKKELIKFKVAKISDVKSLASLRFSLYDEDNEATVSQKKYIAGAAKFFTNSIKSKNWIHFIASVNNEVVGVFSLHVIKHLPRPYKEKYIGYLTNAYVKPKYRNKKIGKKLIKNLLIFAEKKVANQYLFGQAIKQAHSTAEQGLNTPNFANLDFRRLFS